MAKDAEEKDALERDFATVDQFVSAYDTWSMGVNVAAAHMERLEAGDAISHETIESVRKAKQELMATREPLRKLLQKRDLYRPIVLMRKDGETVEHDVMASLFERDLQPHVRSELSKARGHLRDQVFEGQRAFLKAMSEELKEDQAQLARTANNSGAEGLEKVIERLNKLTPEQVEPLAARVKAELSAIERRVSALEAARANEKRWWRPLIEPTILVAVAGVVATGLAYYVKSEIRTAVSAKETVELLDAQLRQLHPDEQAPKSSEARKQESQAQPNHSAPLPSGGPFPVSSVSH